MSLAASNALRAQNEWVTLLFTDIEGSTRLVREYGTTFMTLVGRHFEILTRCTVENNGRVIVTHSDAFFASFVNANDAVDAAIAIQKKFASENWPHDIRLNVRIGIHSGEAFPVSDSSIGYIGLDVNRAARISAAANGGQILVSGATKAELDESRLRGAARLQFLGSHYLKDLLYPESIYELRIRGLERNFPPIRSIENHPTNLPKPGSSFIGRTDELANLSKLLRSQTTRLVTLTGPAGVGKTRLAIQAAMELVDEFEDGVFMIQLEAVSRPSLVLSSIAQTLHIPEYQGRSVLEGLIHFLSVRQVLLIMDNFEHLTDASHDLQQLMRRCPHLHILATSREPLRLKGEKIYSLRPMETPAADEASIENADCVRLFVERAKVANPQFKLDDRNAAHVARICRRLDGLPLAAELAASRLQILNVEELAERLERGFDVLGKSRPGLSEERFSTLQEAILWSYDLLNADEKECLKRMSTFRGGFTVAAAEALCESRFANNATLIDILDSLSEKNLLVYNFGEGMSRFRLLETIREVVGNQFTSDEERREILGKHADYYLKFAEEAATGIVGSEQRRHISNLQMDMDNIRAALIFGIENKDFPLVSRFLSALLWYWIPRSQFSEGLSWVNRALEGNADKRNIDIAHIHRVAGWLKMISGDYGGARPHFQITHDIFEQTGQEKDLAGEMITLGITMAVTEEGMAGPTLIMGGLELCKKHKDRHGTGLALIALGEGSRAGGDIETAADCYEQALQLMRQCDDQYWLGALLLNMSHVALDRNDLAATRNYLAEAVALAESFDYRMMINLFVAMAGELSLKQGRADFAVQLFGAATALLDSIGVTFEPPDQMKLDAAIADARRTMGENDYERNFQLGNAWSRSQAVEHAKSALAE